MDNKDLHILRNVSIGNNKLISDEKLIYESDNSNDFSVFCKDLYKKTAGNYPKFYKMDNLCKLTFLAGEFLTRKLSLDPYPPEQTAIILANTASTIDTDANFVNTLDSVPSPAVFVYTLPNIAAGELCIRHGWKGENIFFITDKFDARYLFEQAQLLFENGPTKLCILGWTEYISPSDYQTILWLVARNAPENSRMLSMIELDNDYNLKA